MNRELDRAYDAAAAAVRDAPGLIVTTHENPDGDAIGSLLGAARSLAAAGFDVWPLMRDVVPREYRWLGLDDVRDTTPADAADRLLLALDCGSAKRVAGDAALLASVARIVNIDHHHDNTRFGDIDVVDPRSACTAMMVDELLRRLGAPMSAAIATPLYVGVVTDTGRFQYANTDAAALRFAARLVEHGAPPHRVFVEVYENVPAAKVRLVGRVLTTLDERLDGRLVMVTVARDDLRATGAREGDSEGVIDYLRAIAGVEVAGVIRELEQANGRPRMKVSLRSADNGVDVSAIARLRGGGGHPQAAGFSSDEAPEEIASFVEREVRVRV